MEGDSKGTSHLLYAYVDVLENKLETNSTVKWGALDVKLRLKYCNSQTNIFDKRVLGVQQKQSSLALLVAASIY